MRTNTIKATFDRPALAAKYQFWRISTSRCYLAEGAGIFDDGRLRCDARSILFAGGSDAWVMLDKAIDARALLGEAIRCSKDNTLSASSAPVDTIPDYILLQLLLNSLESPEHEILRFNNVSGHLYCVSGKRVSARGGVPQQVSAVEVRIDARMLLHMPVRTFTSLKLRKYMTPSKRSADSLPRYGLFGGTTLRRVFDESDDDLVLRQIKGKRASVPFLDMGSKRRFEESKLGMLAGVLRQFERRYGGMASIGFVEVGEEEFRLMTKRSRKWRENVRRMFFFDCINIVDSVGSEESSDIARELADMVASNFELPVSVGESIDDDAPNIVLVHDQAVYAGDPKVDPYSTSHPDCVVQHVTIETLSRKDEISAAIVDTVMKELAIKRDVVEGCMRVIEWRSLHLGGTWTFSRQCKDDDPDSEAVYAFLDIDPDGSMHFSYEAWDPLEEGRHAEVKNAFPEDAEYAVVNGGGSMNFIMSTDRFALPDIKAIDRIIRGGEKVSRNKEARATYLRGVVDISFALVDKKRGIYFAGIAGGGMQSTVPRAARIREVQAGGDGHLFLQDHLELMDVDFVRTKELTVIPFPFKHLREWLAR